MQHDKAFWTALAQADYAVPDGETVRGLTDELLGFLSSPDDGLRDGIAYMNVKHFLRALYFRLLFAALKKFRM